MFEETFIILREITRESGRAAIARMVAPSRERVITIISRDKGMFILICAECCRLQSKSCCRGVSLWHWDGVGAAPARLQIGENGMNSASITDDQVREAAYLLWLEEGQPEGRDEEFWFRAQERLMASGVDSNEERPAESTPGRMPDPKPAAVVSDDAKAASKPIKKASPKVAAATAKPPRRNGKKKRDA